jgi:hypothetical protein
MGENVPSPSEEKSQGLRKPRLVIPIVLDVFLVQVLSRCTPVTTEGVLDVFRSPCSKYCNQPRLHFLSIHNSRSSAYAVKRVVKRTTRNKAVSGCLSASVLYVRLVPQTILALLFPWQLVSRVLSVVTEVERLSSLSRVVC